MSASLPDHPDLDQLRRQAKELRDAARSEDAGALERFARHHPSALPGAVSLTAAQLVVAREHGFSSWPKLKAAVDAATPGKGTVDEFVAASVDGRLRQARAIFGADSDIAQRSLLAATVLGDAEAVREHIALDRDSAVAIDDDRGWPPLLYACYSRWHQIEPDRRRGLAEVARILLYAGASPNTNDGGRPRYRSALKGSVEVNNPDVTQVLLDAGANPDPGEPIAEAANHRHRRCLELLLAHGARVAGTWAIDAAVHADDAPAVALLLESLRNSTGLAAQKASEVLPDAAANASQRVVEALLDTGADPNTSDQEGVSTLRRAVRSGNDATAALLVGRGATDDRSDIDDFLGACRNGDRSKAERLLVDHPDLLQHMDAQDKAVIVDAAGFCPPATIALMLDLGFTVHDRNDFGEQALHSAAYAGNAPVVRLLVDAGADLEARDTNFDGTPLAYATVGSGEQAGKPGNWVETVRLLIDAGAPREDVWISGKPPSEEVAEVLRSYGITADEAQAEQEHDDTSQVNASIGTGVMADVARHIEAAYRDQDLELLGSLLHPDVTWTGLCHNKAQVLDWYRGLQADGTVATVNSVEVDRDAVVLGISVSRRAEGARPVPPQPLWQVCVVEGAEIVDIRFYPDRQSALGRVESGGQQ
jgi:ankyrin repeat protein